jgi:hypothetical protein
MQGRRPTPCPTSPHPPTVRAARGSRRSIRSPTRGTRRSRGGGRRTSSVATGFWRGSVEDAVYGFLDCGIFERGLARVSCTECRAEYLVAFSCQRRGLCPSCAAKRGALFGAFLAEEVVEPVVGHCL